MSFKTCCLQGVQYTAVGGLIDKKKISAIVKQYFGHKNKQKHFYHLSINSTEVSPLRPFLEILLPSSWDCICDIAGIFSSSN
jgi:hypothetical protein